MPPPAQLQEFLWQNLFSDPTQWWDNRRSKRTLRHPDFRHKESRAALFLDNRHKPAWVDSQLAKWDAGMMRPPEFVSTSDQEQVAFVADEGPLEVGMCRKLCEDGRITDAVDVLNLLVQQGCRVPNNLYYLVLKKCITKKDLVLGKRIHALTTESGYEGDAFLATHLISLYASHGRLKEAMQVFTRVPRPSAYTWATIIFAYSRHGEPAQAIKLYRRMHESNVEPNNRVYVAVLKACATAKDLVAGKEVHDHILASPGKRDLFVETGLLDMYAKSGSVEDARRVFESLTERDVVTWNAMIAGYAQRGMGEEALSLYKRMQNERFGPPNSATFVSLLQACASVGLGALHHGKQLHAQIEERGWQDVGVLGGSLVNMYAKCGSIVDARRVFDRLPERDVVTWTAMIAGYVQHGMGQEAITLYSCMQQEGLQADVVLGGSLVTMYAKCGSIGDARRLFDRLPEKNVVTWNGMLAGYAQQAMGQEALKIYSMMQREGITPNTVTFISLLQACACLGVGGLHQGKLVHAQIKERGLQGDMVLGCSLVNMYAKCGSLEDARRVFDRLTERDVVTWNTMIAGYAQQGMGEEALSLYNGMQKESLCQPNSATFVSLLQACASVGLGGLQQGKQLHAQIEERGLRDVVVLGGSLVDMYAKCGSTTDARRVFDRLPEKDVVTWTSMIAGYAQQGMGQEAISLYSSMQQEGLQADVVLWGSLVSMYAKCGSIDNARKLFDGLPGRNLVTWNAMLAGYAQQGMGQETLTLYSMMQQEGITPDSVTFISLLQACSCLGVGGLHQGKQFHAQIEERGLQGDVVLGGSLVNMYAKCGSIEDARTVFDSMTERDVVTWTAMIAGYAQQGMGQEGLSLYNGMQQEGLSPPNSVTFICLLQACAMVAGLPLGKQLHAQIEERGMQADVVVGAALVNMYAKCGSMLDSQQVFDSLPERTTEAWGALIGGYSRQGDSEVVFDLLDRMSLEGIQTDGITFLSMLTVCSHAGLVEKGREYFRVMKTDYGISPTVEHYTCMMDLLGRAGHLDEALLMAKTMPFPATTAVWHTLLGACQKWKNVKIGQQAFECAMSLDGQDAGSYVLMSNIYARAEMWEEAKEMQTRRRRRGAVKKPGQSWWTDMDGVVHTFAVGDKKHPESDGIYARLEQLVPELKREGYVPQLRSSLRDIPDDEKEADLCGHSERLAIAYALNKTPEGTTIRIVKNLRVCEDCHTAIAYMSKVENRTIICRDASRFHLYMHGKCSCGDYW